MRVLLGMILGALLTVGGAYLYDSHKALAGTTSASAIERPLVNWEIVSSKWDRLTIRARDEWNKLTG